MKGFLVFKSTKTDKVMSQLELAAKLARDERFRKQMISAVLQATHLRRRARFAAYEQARTELREIGESLQKAVTRFEKKQSHKVRNTLLMLGAGSAVAAIPQARRFVIARFTSVPSMNGTMPRTIEETIEVNVPVSVAYNQWTQFEDFPLFMEGVDHVQQLDDTRLHWAATIAGKTNEWDAKILEQHPDRQISWISEDGKMTRGTVTFEPRGESKTLIRLSMSYQADPLEAVGSAAGLDSKRIRGDLDRFKELIESKGRESGAWRGEVSAGTKKD
jgi:uncharacterized membrane protein